MSISQFRSPKLIATDLFTSLHGPYGRVPVQFTGTLKTGEFVYFRARGKKIELEIYPSEADFEEGSNLIGSYNKSGDVQDVVPKRFVAADADPEVAATLGAGIMDVETAEDIIIELLGQYLAHKEQAAAQSALADEVALSIEPIV